MTVIFSDDFASALNATNWLDEAAPAVWSTSGGLLLCSTSNFRVLKTTTAAHAAIANCRVTARRASGTNFDACVLARCTITGATSSTSGATYYMDIFDTNQIEVGRRVAGGSSTVLSSFTAAHANGDTFGLEPTGTEATVTLRAYINDIQVGSDIADSAAGRIVVAGQAGCFVFNSSSRFDDFSVDDLVVPGTFIDAGVDALVMQGQAATIGVQSHGLDIAKSFRYPSPIYRM